MPTTLPHSYTAEYTPSSLQHSASFFYLAMPPIFVLLANLIIISFGHHSAEKAERAFNMHFNMAACDEITACQMAELTSIRKIKRH